MPAFAKLFPPMGGISSCNLDIGDVLVPLGVAHVVAGTGQRVPGHTVVGNLNASSFWIALKCVAVNNEVNAVLVVGIVFNAVVAHVELNIAASHAEGNASRNVAGLELHVIAGRANVGVVRVERAPAEAVGTSKLANRQIAVYINRVYASCYRSIMRQVMV